jgi:hypothetical protein
MIPTCSIAMLALRRPPPNSQRLPEVFMSLFL